VFIFFFADTKKKTNQNKRSAPEGMFPRKKEMSAALGCHFRSAIRHPCGQVPSVKAYLVTAFKLTGSNQALILATPKSINLLIRYLVALCRVLDS
jgi:hypothetical protein